jgi:peptide/nickel transport system substrate-binding protein
MPARVNRRRFLELTAMSAAGGVFVACAPQAPRTASQPTAEPAKPAEAAKPAAATQAPLQVSGAAPTAAPAAPTAAAKPAEAAKPTEAAKPAAATPGKYKEAPALAELVKAGKLPPVEQRLPENPRVLKPLEEVGQYGGTWHRAFRGLADRLAVGKLMEERLIEWDAPDPNTLRVVPNVVEKWEQSADATEFTFYLRKGIRWSDGTELSTDDVRFFWEDIMGNAELIPAPPLPYLTRQRVGNEWKPATLTIVDKTTWKVKYPAPNPLLPIGIAKNGGNAGHQNEVFTAFFSPAHYLKQFLPKYADGGKEALDKLAQEKKLTSWVDLWGKGGDMTGPIGSYLLNPDLPTINAWKMTQVLPADPVRMERSPYYWQVDTEGNQLPYIDAVEHAFFENAEILKLWVAQGKIDCQNRMIDVGAYTFFKENESKGDYRVLHWRSASTQTYFPNQNCPDPVLAKLFATPELRQALNISINRKEIAEVVYSGLYKPRQYSPITGSPEYDPEMEKVWTEYDPKKANELLDGLGLKKGPDGMRLRPDGQPLAITIEHASAPGLAENDMHELVRKAWTAIGINTSIKGVDRALYMEHYRTGDMEVGQWGWDRASANKADPGRWLGTIDDGPWAPTYGHWYDQNAWKKEEPPQDHPIRKIWDFWEKTRTEPDEAKSNAYFKEIIDIHKQAPVAVGVVGENVSPWIVKNNFRNVLPGFINDDTLRDYGLINPAQFFLKK